MPLNLADKNKTYVIQRIVGREGVVRRLKSLGFVPGTEIRVLSVIGVCQHIIIMRDKKTQHQMGHDELTDVCNWEHLLQKAERLYEVDKPRYIIYSDIAEFKLINELFGRETGNRIFPQGISIILRFIKSFQT